MSAILHSRRYLVGVIGLVLWLCSGCGSGKPTLAAKAADSGQQTTGGSAAPASSTSPPEAAAEQPESPANATTKQLGKNVWLEVAGKRRRVIVGAAVCLREGMYGLECLLCRQHTKEHESVLSTDADGKMIHAALLACGAEPGSPVKYVEHKDRTEVIPPSGPVIKVSVQYRSGGKTVTRPAQELVQNQKTKKPLEYEWVFAGSTVYPNPDDPSKKPVYAANVEGNLISIYNLPSAMLDLPVNSPNRDPSEREYQPYTEHIPPLDSRVYLFLEPAPKAAKPPPSD